MIKSAETLVIERLKLLLLLIGLMNGGGVLFLPFFLPMLPQFQQRLKPELELFGCHWSPRR